MIQLFVINIFMNISNGIHFIEMRQAKVETYPTLSQKILQLSSSWTIKKLNTKHVCSPARWFLICMPAHYS